MICIFGKAIGWISLKLQQQESIHLRENQKVWRKRLRTEQLQTRGGWNTITSLKVPLCSSLKKCIVGKQGWDSGIFSHRMIWFKFDSEWQPQFQNDSRCITQFRLSVDWSRIFVNESQSIGESFPPHNYSWCCTYMDTNAIDRAKFDKNIFACIRARQKWDYWEMKAAALTVHLIRLSVLLCDSHTYSVSTIGLWWLERDQTPQKMNSNQMD